MSSFLCFICHSTVNTDTSEDIREKYRDVVGMNIRIESQLCYICCHVLNKLWMFKSVCLKRSLEYPVLFSEKGTLNLHCSDIELTTVCQDGTCGQHYSRNINSKSYHYCSNSIDNTDSREFDANKYFELRDERNDFDNYFAAKGFIEERLDFESKAIQTDAQEERDTPIDAAIDVIDNHGDVDLNDDIGSEIIDNENVLEKNEEENHIEECKVTVDENSAREELNDVCEGEIKEKGKRRKKKDGFDKLILSLDEQKAELEAKRKQKKYLEAEFKCYNCAMGFLFKDSYQAHMMRHEESNGEHVCAVCSLRFASGCVYRSHRGGHRTRHRCRRCGLAVSPRAVRRHAAACAQRTDDQQKAHCHLCAKMFRDASGLQQHLKRYHQAKTSTKRHACSVCGKTYNNHAAVRTHMITHVNRKFSCEDCGATYSSPYTMAAHKRSHLAASGWYYCAPCDVTLSSLKGLVAHRRNTANHQQTILECPICSRMCPTQKSLASHMEAVHATGKPHECTVGGCTARYTNRKSLVRHIRTHVTVTAGGTAICHYCGVTFKSNSKLNHHLREVCEKKRMEGELTEIYQI